MVEVELADVGKLQDHNSQAWAVEFIELTYLGISCRMPPEVGGQSTIKEAKP